MTRLIDIICPACEKVGIDQWVKLESFPACTACGTITIRYRGMVTGPTVIGDDIPGGLEIHHGLCHDDGSPRKFYTKSEIRRAAAEKGLTWGVTEHVSTQGSDKSPHSSRWY